MIFRFHVFVFFFQSFLLMNSSQFFSLHSDLCEREAGPAFSGKSWHQTGRNRTERGSIDKRSIANNVSGVHSMPAAPGRMRHWEWRANVRSLRLAHMHWLRTKTKCRQAFGMRHNGSAALTHFHSALFRTASNVPMHHRAEMSATERVRSRQIRETDTIRVALRRTLWQFAVVQWSRGSRQIHTEILQLQRSLVRRWSSKNVRHCSGERTRDTIDRSATRGHLQFSFAGRAFVRTESDQIVFGWGACSVLVAESNSQRWTSQHFLFGYIVGHRGASKSFIANENVPLWLRAMYGCDGIGHQLQCIALRPDRVCRTRSPTLVGRVEFELVVSDVAHTAIHDI